MSESEPGGTVARPRFDPEALATGMAELTAAVEAWARRDARVLAAVLIGSRARPDRPADAYSDLDVVFVTDDPAGYLDGDGWLDALGHGAPLTDYREQTLVPGIVERRVMFPGWREADFVPVPTALARSGEAAAVFAGIARRGFRVLADGAGLLAALLPAGPPGPPATPGPPTEAEYRQCLHDYLHHVVWSLKKLARGELWMASGAQYGTLRRTVLRLLEWEAATRPEPADTWHEGRFVDRWGDRAALDRLPAALAGGYDTAGVLAAHRAGLELVRELGTALGGRSGYAYPENAHLHVVGLL
ncbi:MAG: aminoglycoside 6-adenylyltransferase [Mycobacteriales bacterium]